MSANLPDKFSKSYSDESFWDKLKDYAVTAGIKVVYASLLLFYALKDPRTPARAKTIILGALGYFIAPVDAILDIMPVAGYTDDLGVLVMALAVVAMHIDDKIKAQARQKIAEWFPNAAEAELAEIDEKLK